MSTQDNRIENSSAMQELRALLFQSESARISEIERILNNQELHAQEIAKVLAEAVKIRSKADNKLGQALTPAVEEALKASIARDPKPISDALFPVMGPAIRKAINSSIAAMMQSLNQTLEHSFSAQGLRWRLDALKTGKPFAEVVLLNTLVYRVEQVFLIHKETGLLLHHLSFDPALNEDADVVSSMLTAVRDFIHDSFSGNADQEIDNLRMGDLEIMIEQSPDMVLAVVSRGNPPRSLQDSLQPILEEIQQDFHNELQQFEGNTDDFDGTDILLSELMVADYQGQSEKKSSSSKPMVIIGLILIGIAGWLGWSYQQQSALTEKWKQYIQSLTEQPGIIITHVSNDDGHYTLSGLRDPLSIDPIKALEAADLPQDHLKLKFQSYQALQEPLILKRARALLQPPQSAKLELHEQTLSLSGSAPTQWINHAKTTAPFIAGIHKVDASHIAPAMSLIVRIKAVLQPTNQVELKLIHDNQLIASGKATSAWAKQAKVNIKKIQDIHSYNDKDLTRLDSPEYIVLQAYKKLSPPKTVQLVVTPQLVLIANGTASDTWIKQAKQKAAQLAYITAYRDSQVSLSDNIVLQRANIALQPPETVTLSFSKHTLVATGTASQAWIDKAHKTATTIHGVNNFENQVSLLRDDNIILAEALKLLQPPTDVKLTFSNGILHATGRANNTWIEYAQNQFPFIDGIHSFYTSKLENITATWSTIQKDITQINIQFSSSSAKITPEIRMQISHLAGLFKQALALQKSSYLEIIAAYRRNDTFISSLQLKSIKKELMTHAIDATYIKIRTIKDSANSENTQAIQTLLKANGSAP